MKVSWSVTPVAWALGCACVAVFCIQWLSERLPVPGAVALPGQTLSGVLLNAFGLNAQVLAQGALWQPLTYAFLQGSVPHLLANLLGLWITGSALEPLLGGRRTGWLFVLGSLAGAVGFLASLMVDSRLSAARSCIGASAGVAAFLGCATLLAPKARLVLWVVVLPIPMRAWMLLPLFVLFSLAELLLWPQFTAYGAHLGGWLMGLLCALAWRKNVDLVAEC